MRKAFLGLLALLLATCCGCTTNRTSEGEFLEGAWLNANNIVSVGNVLYGNTNDGRLYAFDVKAGTRTELENTTKETLHYLKSDGEKLYAAGWKGAGGIYVIDPEDGQLGKLGFYLDLAMTDWALMEGTAYVGAVTADGYGLYGFELAQMPETANAPLIERSGYGEFSTVIARGNELLLHESITQAPFSGQIEQRLIRYEVASGKETVLAENIGNYWTPCIEGSYFVTLIENKDPYTLRPCIIDGEGKVKQKLEAMQCKRVDTAKADGHFVMDCYNSDGTRSIAFIDPNSGSLVKSVSIDASWGSYLGADTAYMYFWDQSGTIDSQANLMALDLDTLEAVNLFEKK